MKALIFLTLLFVVAANAARIAPDLEPMLPEELDESVVAFQAGAGRVQSENTENQLDLGGEFWSPGDTMRP